MPRAAHGRPLLKSGPSKPPKGKPQRNAALNALETAERQNPDVVRIRQHRLGEVEDDSDVPETRADADERSSKRRKITNERAEEDDVEEGSDLEGGTWHTGVNEDDEDSDLDSDEAFGESDEERFADFMFRGSENKSARPGQPSKPPRALDLDEKMDEEDSDNQLQDSDDLGDEAVDLAVAWDMDDADRQEPSRKQSGRKSTQRGHSASEDSDVVSDQHKDGDDSEEDTEDNESQFSISTDEMDGDPAALRSFVDSLSTSKPENKQQPRHDSRVPSSKPSQFGLPPSKISASDLLQYVKDPAQRQSLKILQNAERSGPEEYRGGIPGKLSAPLAKRQQDRLDRVAAYEKSKETLNRWIDTVKQNRRAEHLSFPLLDHAKDSSLGQKQLMPTNQSAPTTELEAAIDKIMQESGVNHASGRSTEDQELAFEELAGKEMDVDDVKARRAELRMARELMFREEIRARRIKKIKSKAYRRVHRKERGRIEAEKQESLVAAGLLNSDDEKERQDRRRAEERMGARHRESRWAKGVKQAGRATWDDNVRAGVLDSARRDEDLRRRIEGKNAVFSEGSEADESDSGSDYDADTDEEGQRLTARLDILEKAEALTSGSKLGQMAFMQRAEAARKIENDEEIRQMRLALDDAADGQVGSEDEYHEPNGRQKFGTRSRIKAPAAPKKPKNEFEAPLSEEEGSIQDSLADQDKAQADESEGTSKPKPSMKANNGAGKDRKSPSNHKHVPDLKSMTSQPSKKIGSGSRRIEASLDDYTSPSGSEDDGTDNKDQGRDEATLAASIFAGPDDVVKEFAKEKAEVVEEEGDQVIDNTLPGWGSWTGAGVSKREQKKDKGRFLSTIKGVAPDKRQDSKLDRVIINEKRNKKNGKYLATELPHPFESRQQYERSLRLPIGPEWSTTNHYQDAIKPRVLLKQGTVIRPIAKPIS